MRFNAAFVFFILLAFPGLEGCSNSSGPGGSSQGVSLTLRGLSANRPGEQYAFWLEFPKVSAERPKSHSPLHGSLQYKLVSVFRVMSDGTMSGLDTTALSARLGFSLTLAAHADISVEPLAIIPIQPTALYLVGEVTGTTNEGISLPRTTHSDVFGDTITRTNASFELASPASAPSDFIGEFYLMKGSGQLTPSMSGVQSLPPNWSYGVWSAINRSSDTLYRFLGFFNLPNGHDSDSSSDSFSFPGGRSPTDRSQSIINLTDGNGSAIISLEPHVTSAIPSRPFVPLLASAIPTGTKAFISIAMQNLSAKLPTAEVHIFR